MPDEKETNTKSKPNLGNAAHNRQNTRDLSQGRDWLMYLGLKIRAKIRPTGARPQSSGR